MTLKEKAYKKSCGKTNGGGGGGGGGGGCVEAPVFVAASAAPAAPPFFDGILIKTAVTATVYTAIAVDII